MQKAKGIKSQSALFCVCVCFGKQFERCANTKPSSWVMNWSNSEPNTLLTHYICTYRECVDVDVPQC